MRRSSAVQRERPFLADLLSIALPGTLETLLLRALLLEGARGATAFRAWNASVGDARRALGADEQGFKQMFAMLYVANRAVDVARDGDLAAYLRIAYARERLRGRVFYAACAEVLAVLGSARVPAMLVGGAAAAILAYDDPLPRHAHAIDLLVMPADLERATAVLAGAGYARSPGQPTAYRRTFTHATGAPIVLHAHLFDLPCYRGAEAAIWSSTRQVTLGGVAVSVPSSADLLLLVCAAGSAMHVRCPPWWVCDAWRVIQRSPDLDWSVLLARASIAHLCLPLWISLRYLHAYLDAPIPEAVLARLATRAAVTTASGYEAALWTLRRSVPHLGRRRMLRSATGWQSRMILLKWFAFPLTTHLDVPAPWRHRALLPAFHVYRMLRWVARRARAARQPARGTRRGRGAPPR